MSERTSTVFREGTMVGLIGAALVGVWFFVVDLIAGRPFFTPSLLGSAVFFGLRDPAAATISVKAVLAYTGLHLVAFHIVGLVVSAILAEARKTPHVLWLLAEFFLVFEFGFQAAIGLTLKPVLAELAWFNVAFGNLIAAGGMGYYLWRVHRGSIPAM